MTTSAPPAAPLPPPPPTGPATTGSGWWANIKHFRSQIANSPWVAIVLIGVGAIWLLLYWLWPDGGVATTTPVVNQPGAPVPPNPAVVVVDQTLAGTLLWLLPFFLLAMIVYILGEILQKKGLVTAGKSMRVTFFLAALTTVGMGLTWTEAWKVFDEDTFTDLQYGQIGVLILLLVGLVGLAKIWKDGGSGASKTVAKALIIIACLLGVMYVGLGEDLFDQTLTYGQEGLKNGVDAVTDGNPETKLEWGFDWGTFLGWSFIGITFTAMAILALKGNKLIAVPLGVAGLIFFLVVGGYQALQLKPVSDAFGAVGIKISNLNPLPSFSGETYEADLNRRDEYTFTLKKGDVIEVYYRRLKVGICHGMQYFVGDDWKFEKLLATVPDEDIVWYESQGITTYHVGITDKYVERYGADGIPVRITHHEWAC